jgi:CubicO group peptidase (beta-lactamase class C family)
MTGDATRREADVEHAAVSDALRDHFSGVAATLRAPVIVYGVVLGGEIVAHDSVGDACDSVTIQELHLRSRICSLTKSFVAAALLMLRDAGMLALDDPVGCHVPEVLSFRPPTADSPPLTIRSLLTMSAGLPEDDPWADRLMLLDGASVDRILEAGATFAHPPFTRYEYSNLSWVILGRVVTNVTGSPVQRFIHDSLLRPLGMNDTTWSRPSAPSLDGNVLRERCVVPEPADIPDGDFAPMAGIWSSVSDLSRWVSFFLDAYPPRDASDDLPLARASRREMQQLHRVRTSDTGLAGVIAGTGTVGYGYGLRVEHDARFGHLAGHSGGLPGYGSHMAWLPGRNVGVVALANLTYAGLGAANYRALELVDQAGLVTVTPVSMPGDHVRSAAQGLFEMLSVWEESRERLLFAENVLLDASRDERRRDAGMLRDRIGGQLRLAEVSVEAATRGWFEIVGASGVARVKLLLTPEVPPRIQRYTIAVE